MIHVGLIKDWNHNGLNRSILSSVFLSLHYTEDEIALSV